MKIAGLFDVSSQTRVSVYLVDIHFFHIFVKSCTNFDCCIFIQKSSVTANCGVFSFNVMDY